MTKREKNILTVAALVGVVFLLTQGLPSIRGAYQARTEQIAQLQLEIERELRLIEDTPLWSERRDEVEARGVELSGQLFQENSIPLISASVQRLVRDYATQNDITVTSTKLAESTSTEGWLLVEQELSILTSKQSNILRFLEQIETSRPLLAVNSISIRRNRNQYAGTITVVGFSKAATQVDKR